MTLRGAAAEEAAELEDLRKRAEQRRREVGETLTALVERVSESADARAFVGRALGRAGQHARSAVRAASRRPVLAVGVGAMAAAAAAAWWTARHRDPPNRVPVRASAWQAGRRARRL